jgi:hypothetical protein
MAKRLRTWNQNKFCQYLKDGRGQGEGSAYMPWIRVQDFSSQGIVSRIAGQKTKRVHHFLSRNELSYFYLLEWSDQVLDIREQFPLDSIDIAAGIARDAGIRYPSDNISGFPYILTCDFMITTRDGMKARTIKNASDLENRRTLEKLEIERRYWNHIGIDWRLVTENELPMQKVRNIEWLYTSTILPAYLDNSKLREATLLRIKDGQPILSIIELIDSAYDFPKGSGLSIIKNMIWRKQIQVDMNSDIRSAIYFC